MNRLVPICVDLDGTLLKEDVTAKALKIYIGWSPLNIFNTLFWLMQGWACLKQKLAELVQLDPSSLKYNEKFLEFIEKKKKEGHKIFLATACNQIYARKIADYLGIFDGVFASTDCVNLRAEAKAQTLTTIFGENGFIYAGNSEDDVYVWNKSAWCILVSPSKGALKKMRGRKYLLFD
ncbi:MAG: haloacid dehalogenase-like hydrolase [Holosporaceae bacterium]|jgi:phosphoserine phosphatase|nr:haloacid dehalogenase-like hydrolase [Holosporaceae bacterium]